MRPAGHERHRVVLIDVGTQPGQHRRWMQDRGSGVLCQPVHAGGDQGQEQQQRQQHARAPVAEQASQAAARHQQGREEARDDKEQRHAEQVQEPGGAIDDNGSPRIGRRPDRVHQGAVGQRCMEQDAGQHGQRPQMVHVVEAVLGLHGDALKERGLAGVDPAGDEDRDGDHRHFGRQHAQHGRAPDDVVGFQILDDAVEAAHPV